VPRSEDQLHKRCDALSGGQKQRVSIARALVQEPRLILCDEPIASLDPGSARTIMDHLRRISRELNITVLMNLHQVDVAIKYSDRIVGIREGRIVYDGDPKALKKQTIAETASFVPNQRAVKALPNIVAKLGETVLVSVMASVLAAAASVFLAILASRTTRPHLAVWAAVRLVASVCRNISVVA
jgi:ABC-type multidrug transport system ATPase subunit